ncbi:adenylate cyclase [Natronospira proteinivora]|uniref:Adenylate cyclase n=1 Tax=Natronospira proteinivora TaxID=1807133 RepID=A0ABT1GC18_9GAMM|nr:adenylate/guanylate cyclase domain-containing protein [Natronospira proteinivora]MCP1727823.1 adenylate cyclase [Natronospira proteinivora]
MQWSHHKKQARWLVLIGLLAGLLVTLIHLAGGFQRLEWISQDARTQVMRSEARVHEDLALVLIDETSLTQLNPLLGRFPWPRSVYADLLEFLAQGNPRAVVFDVLFSENQWLDNEARDALSREDEALAMETAAAGNVHHALHVHRESPDEQADTVRAQALPDFVVNRHALSRAEGFPDLGRNSYLLPFDELAQMSAGLGGVGLDSDADGVYRRVSPFFVYQDAVLPGLSTTALHEQLAPEVLQQGDQALHMNGQVLPVDGESRLHANFYGDVPAFSFSGLIQSRSALLRGEADRMLVQPEEFEDKIVFIGGSAIGLHDIKHTPMDSRTPGVEIHLTAASNLLKGDYLRPMPVWFTPVLIMALSLLTALGFLMSRVYRQSLLPLALMVAHVGFAFWAFGQHYLVDLVAPVAGLAFSGLFCMAYVSATEGRDRRRVRRMLSQYVSPAVLAEVVDRYEDHISAEVGTDEEMTILFSDIRGFTGISESYPPAQVVELLNRYLSRLSDAIFDHDGTLDKFIGDAIMAFWGAPIRVADHADRAVLAGLAMQRQVDALNQELEAEGQPLLRTGIGLHSGRVVLGNIGSDRKLDYTVIGDNVNLASRIEGLTSHYGCPLLISDITYRALSQEVICALVDRVRVKGKQQSVAVWRPLAGPEDGPEWRQQAMAIRQTTEAAWACYEARQWDEALVAFQALPEGDPVRAVFVERCRAYARSGVSDDWQGVHGLDSK